MSLIDDQNINTTPISSLGEFGLIDHLTKNFTSSNPKTVQAIGDDCAVIDRGDVFELLSTDMLVEGVHFDLAYVPLKHLGYKSIDTWIEYGGAQAQTDWDNLKNYITTNSMANQANYQTVKSLFPFFVVDILNLKMV